jgi:hypothetical protein
MNAARGLNRWSAETAMRRDIANGDDTAPVDG